MTASYFLVLIIGAVFGFVAGLVFVGDRDEDDD